MGKKKCWRLSMGEYGCRVVLFERTAGGPLYREVYQGGKRVANKRSLGHSDRKKAKAQAYELLAALKSEQPLSEPNRLTLTTLFDNYTKSPAFQDKAQRTQREDKRKLDRVIAFLGRNREARSLCESDVTEYVQRRKREVRDRAVEADLVALRTALNWATRQRTGHGEPLLAFNPLRGVKLPFERNPRRPVETFERYLQLIEVAADVDWRLPAALTLAESTGQRISAILGLRRDDVKLSRKPYGWLRFRAEHQKNGREHEVPITRECKSVLQKHLKRCSREWLFASEQTPSRPVDVFRISRLLRDVYAKAGLETFDGGLWHPWRRKWATERKGMSLRDVAEAGGWRDPQTLLKCYMQPDEATMMRVFLEAEKL